MCQNAEKIIIEAENSWKIKITENVHSRNLKKLILKLLKLQIPENSIIYCCIFKFPKIVNLKFQQLIILRNLKIRQFSFFRNFLFWYNYFFGTKSRPRDFLLFYSIEMYKNIETLNSQNFCHWVIKILHFLLNFFLLNQQEWQMTLFFSVQFILAFVRF